MTAEPCPKCGEKVESSQENHSGVDFDVLKCTTCGWGVSKAALDSNGNALIWDC